MNTVIAVDFDGTLCENRYPEIGEPRMSLINQVKFAKSQGMKVILWTCRTEKLLDEAVGWCEEHGLVFDAVNENLQERIDTYGGDCRKISADFYLDDKAVTI